MPNSQTRITLLDEFARDHVPYDVDLWPEIAATLSTRRRPPYTRLDRGQLWRIAVVATALLLSIIVLPPTRQTIADTIQHFGIVETNSTTVRIGPPAPGATAVSVPVPMYSLEEAQKRVPYPIPQPSWIPAGFRLRGVFVGHDDVVTVSYVSDDWQVKVNSGAFGFSVHPGTEPSLGGTAIPSTAIRHVTVNGAPAIYAQGAWEHQPDGMTWHGDADAVRVAWAADGFTYDLSGSKTDLGRDGLIRIAESIHP
jgi:hypothetical protein